LYVVGQKVEASPLDLFLYCRDRALIAVEILRVGGGKLSTEISVLVDQFAVRPLLVG